MRKFLFTVTVNLILSAFLSFTVTVAVNTFNGASLTVDTVVLPLAYGILIGTITATVIPVNKIGIRFATINNAGPGTALCSFYKNLVILAIMVPIMNFFVTGLLIGFFTPPFVDAWLCPIPTVYPVGYVTALLAEPIAVFIARSITRYNPLEAQEVAVPATPDSIPEA